MKFLAISGSARVGSTNTELLHCLSDCAPLHLSVDVFADLAGLPVFSPDHEGLERPASVQRFIDMVDGCDGIVIASPEYVRGIPGGLKNAIDWLVSGEAIVHKPIALLHASHRGDDMLAALRLVLSTVSTRFNADIFEQFALMSKSQDEIRTLLSDVENKARLTGFLADFSHYIAEK